MLKRSIKICVRSVDDPVRFDAVILLLWNTHCFCPVCQWARRQLNKLVVSILLLPLTSDDDMVSVFCCHGDCFLPECLAR